MGFIYISLQLLCVDFRNDMLKQDGSNSTNIYLIFVLIFTFCLLQNGGGGNRNYGNLERSIIFKL